MPTDDNHNITEPVLYMEIQTFAIIYGVLIILTACFVVLLYVFIFKVILSDSEMREMIVYRFVILLGICDVVEASVHCVTGFALLFPNFWSTPLDNVFGSLLVPTYFCYILTGLLLSFVRFMQIVYPDYATMLFSSGRGKFWLAIIFAVFLPYFGLIISPLSMCKFNFMFYTWEYDMELPLSYFIMSFEQYVQQTMIGLTCFFYIAIFVGLWKLGNMYATNSQRERLIMYQTFFVTIYATTFNIASHNMWWINSGNVPQLFALSTYMWVLNTAVYPITCLTTTRRNYKAANVEATTAYLRDVDWHGPHGSAPTVGGK
ncbi:hypothetical protein Aduo_012799 [Ancylostoma duodenale]